MSANPQDPFASIRPYNDNEVAAVVQGLLNTPELVDALTRFRFPRAHARWGFLLRPLVGRVLKGQLSKVNTIFALQQVTSAYMTRMIDSTTGQLTYHGLEKLDPKRAYLFISNHRDIAMDPAFVNWGLFQQGRDTVRIAIGDNLLRKPYVSDLMRLNKSFIVKRSVKGREKLTALLELSSYINHSILNEGQSVWIAQREGRAKDGNDRTDPAILKMFYASQKKQASFAEAMQRLAIVPVSISYEYDPCDAAKARELTALAAEGRYEKSEYEDIESIVRGITGYKGDVQVTFGEPVEPISDSAEELAERIDQVIHANYYLHASNLIASDQREGVSAAKINAFDGRLAAVPEADRQSFMQMYAYPVANQKRALAEEKNKEIADE